MSAIWRIATGWYTLLLLAAAVGIAIGYFVFFYAYPEKPKIGIIDIPFTVLDQRSAPTIDAFLDYARDRDDIKAVVIRLTSPGSRGGAGEQLYMEVRRLRDEKPVVIAVGDLAASGAYMLSMGANYIYAHPGSLVGSVGVFVPFRFPTVPQVPDEGIIRTGPQKGLGATKRDWLGLLDQAKEHFYQIVAAERGDRLRLSKEEVLEAGIYWGPEAVRLGLIDAVGYDTEAIEKAAGLADISGYELVDVNTEVERILFEKLRYIIDPLIQDKADMPDLAAIGALLAPQRGTGDSADPRDGIVSIESLRRLLLPSGVSEAEEELSDFGVDLDIPRIYHLYVAPSQ